MSQITISTRQLNESLIGWSKLVGCICQIRVAKTIKSIKIAKDEFGEAKEAEIGKAGCGESGFGRERSGNFIHWVKQINNDMLTFLCFTNPLRPAILSEVEFDFHCPERQFV